MDFPFSVSSEDKKDFEEIFETLAWLVEADDRPFPYADIPHIYKTVTSRKIQTRRAIKKGFGPDLSTYLYSIYSPARWCDVLLGWPIDKRQNLAESLAQDFFERWPEYLLVRRWITEANTPDLYRTFVIYEEMRLNVLALLRLLDRLESQNKDGD